MLQRAVIQNIQWDTFHIAMEPQPSNEEQPRLKTGMLRTSQMYHGRASCNKQTNHFSHVGGTKGFYDGADVFSYQHGQMQKNNFTLSIL